MCVRKTNGIRMKITPNVLYSTHTNSHTLSRTPRSKLEASYIIVLPFSRVPFTFLFSQTTRYCEPKAIDNRSGVWPHWAREKDRLCCLCVCVCSCDERNRMVATIDSHTFRDRMRMNCMRRLCHYYTEFDLSSLFVIGEYS